MRNKQLLDQRADALVEGDVIKIAKAFGFVVATADLEGKCSGFIMVNTARRKILGIKAKRLIVVDRHLYYDDSRLLVARALVLYDLCGHKDVFARMFKREGKNVETITSAEWEKMRV